MQLSKIKLAVVDDHKLFRGGIISQLKEYQELSVNFEAENGVEFFKELNARKRPIDVLLLDVEMPEMDGFEVLRKLKKIYPLVKPLILTMHNEDEMIYELVELGARGILQKNADIEEVVDAIYALHDGELYFNEEISKKVIKKLVKKQAVKKAVFYETLSDREKEIIRLICQECTTKEIAQELFISERTVETHRQNIFKKTRTKTTAGMVMYAVRAGIV